MENQNENPSKKGSMPSCSKGRRRQSVMRRGICVLLCFCMLLTAMPLSTYAAASAASNGAGKHPFTDVSDESWYNDAVQYVYENGIFSGTAPDTFTPNGTMTRGMFVTVLGRMAGVSTKNYSEESSFRDVSESDYYAPYVAWAAKYGITSGTSKDTFSPDAMINRQEMATFFVRYFKAFDVEYDAYEKNTTLPADLDEASDWAKESVQTLWQTGLLVGDGTDFNPKDNATRAQCATLCMRIHKAVKAWKSEKIDSEKKTDSSDSSSDSTTQYYEIKFASGNGQDSTDLKLPETSTLRSGTKISELSTPYQAGKIFLGWYYDADMKDRAKTDDVIEKNMTLYAKMADADESNIEETPTYITKTDVSTEFTFYVKAADEEAVKKALTVTQVTANNAVLGWEDEDGLKIAKEGDYFKVTGAYQGGQTYQVQIDEDSDVLFFVDDEKQPDSVNELNFITAKEEVMNLKLKDGLVYLKKQDVEYGKDTPLEGLFSADAMEGETIQSVENNGTFTYNGKEKIKAGDTVAIYEGVEPDKRTLDTDNDDTIVYVTVTEVDGKTVKYTTADTSDVLFTPDVLPIKNSQNSNDSNASSGKLTVDKSELDFSQYEIPGLDSDTSIDEGDYIAFYDGDYTDSSEAGSGDGAGSGHVTSYACITDVTKSGDSYTIEYKTASEEEMMESMAIYSTRTKDIELTDEETAQVQSEIEDQVKQSGYAEKAVETLSLMAQESDDLDDLYASLNTQDGVSYSLSEAGTSDSKENKKASNASIFNALKDLKKDTTWKTKLRAVDVTAKVLPYTKTHFNEAGCIGVQVSLEYELKVPLNKDESNELTIKISAEIEQDFMLTVNVSGDAVWKKKWIFPYIADYRLNANLDAGAYTGLSVSFSMNTGEAGDDDGEDEEEEEEEKTDEDKLMFLGMDWSFLWGDPDEDDDEDDDDEDSEYHGIIGKYAERLGAKVDEIAEDSEDFLADDEDEDDDDEDMLKSLREQYAELVEGADDAWIKLVDKEIFSFEGAADPLHILVYGIKANFVIKMNAYATLGATFEYGHAKRYNFSILVSEKKATNKVLDLESANYELVFYIMGTLGLRAGIELELAVGLCSLKLDSVGVTAEAGAYATACGFFYYKLGWEQGSDVESANAGAFHAEIGAYVDINFNAKLFNSDSLTYEKSLYGDQWAILTLGERENVYSFNYLLDDGDDDEEDDDDDTDEVDSNDSTDADEDESSGPTYTVENAKTLTLPSSLFEMAYMDLQTGELFGAEADDDEENPAKNFDDETESRFDVSLSNPKFSYDPKTNTITVAPDGSVEETCEMTLTWKGNSAAFSSLPISLTVTIEWSDIENARYISFDSQGGTTVSAIARTAGASISEPASPFKTGYEFGGWYEDAACTKEFTMPASMPDYSSEDKGITVYAKWTPSKNTPYRVEYYEQELNGTYTLSDSEWKFADTDSKVSDAADDIIIDKTGFKLNAKKSTTDQTVAANASTVVKLYYDRAKYNLTFSYGLDGKEDLVTQVKYGAEISAPSMHTAGYTFKDWDKTVASAMPASDVTYTALWTPNTDTAYKVAHFKQTAVGGSFICVDEDTEYMTGTTGTQTEAKAKNYEGYTAENIKQQAIKADGSTQIRILYDLNAYTITYEGLDDSDTTERKTSFTVKGESFTLETPKKTGYTFVNWTCDNKDVTISDEGVVTIPANVTDSIKITANWNQNPVKLLDPNGSEYKTLVANTPLDYTISYTDNGKTITDAAVAYWLNPNNQKHYCSGDTVEAGVESLQAVLMSDDVPMEINKSAQLERIAEEVSKADAAWSAGNYKLLNTVALTSSWAGIGSIEDKAFTGTFDGSKCMIVYGDNPSHSLFNYIDGATIKNLTVQGTLESEDKYIGGIASYAKNRCSISDCSVYINRIALTCTDTCYVGGVVGYASGTEDAASIVISNCSVQNLTVTGSSDKDCYAGGIAGMLVNANVSGENTSLINACNITASFKSGDGYAGVVAGLVRNTNIYDMNVQNCNIYVKASGDSSEGNACTGGIVGEFVSDEGGMYEFFNCTFQGGSTTPKCSAAVPTGGKGTAYIGGAVGRVNLKSDTPSQLKINTLTINGPVFAASGSKTAAASIIGEIVSDGRAENNVTVIPSAISATVKENDAEVTDNNRIRVIPSDAATETTTKDGIETISITCPISAASGGSEVETE